GALAPCREFFHRDGRLVNQPFTWGWIASIALVTASSVWLGLFAYKHVQYENELWWSFGFDKDASRFLRAAFGSVTLLFLFAIFELFRPAKPAAAFATVAELDKAAVIVAASPRTAANLALLGDKRLLFSADETAFIMYGTQGHSWISMGDPVGAPDQFDDLVWSFRTHCDRYEALPVFYQVEADHLPLYLDHGLSLLKIGEEAQVPLADFALEGSVRKQLRQTQNRYQKLDCTFEILDYGQVADRIGELREVSDEWLREKNAAEKGFSLGNFTEDYIKRFPTAVIWQQGRIIAFANLWAGSNHEEMSVDLMRYRSNAPAGVMEHLFIELMLWGREHGYRYFSLGMAPLSGLDNRPLAPLWHRVGGLVFRHGEHFYNFEGLRNYKDKFHPEWRPKYIAAPGGFHVTRVLGDVATLISGGVRGLITR
ncbi:MAG: bifunctional lysylphosphatidylglycerol flippase/synthetase MprF, partial [Planctomycetales bacterium]|nr:bifunctional lysylphosphatidylglycerol flippase/synthetase MprF [Planctomycetales bacterium]